MDRTRATLRRTWVGNSGILQTIPSVADYWFNEEIQERVLVLSKIRTTPHDINTKSNDCRYMAQWRMCYIRRPHVNFAVILMFDI